jgi:hypothetical protein
MSFFLETWSIKRSIQARRAASGGMALFGAGKFLDFAAVDGLDESITVGTELVKELIEVGHQVRGLTRSAEGLEQLKKVGAEDHRGEQAAEHFGWFAHFAGVDMPASSEWTRKTLGWDPTGPGLIEDLTNMKY